jgi:O-antigen/teichoic acid export membrane protein
LSASSTHAFQPQAVIRRLRGDRLLRNNAIYLAGSVGGGLMGYVFHFVSGRLLGPAGYSVVASAIAALYLLTLPSVVLQLVSARYASLAIGRDERERIPSLILRLTGVTMLGGAPAVLILLVFGPTVASFLNVNDPRVIFVLAPAALGALLVAANRGVLQGMQRFLMLSGNVVLDMTVRVLVGAFLITIGLGPIGALVAVLLGPIAAYGQSLYVLRDTGRRVRRDATPGEGLGRYAILAAVAALGVNYLLSVDTLLAKHYLPAGDAGVYAAGSVLARVAYFLGLSVAAVMFPEVATLHARDERHFHVVDKSLLLIIVMGAGLVLAYAALPQLVLLPYGSGFGRVTPYLGPFALALSLMALANLLMNYSLSVNRTWFIWPLFGTCALETVLIARFHSGVAQIVTMMVISMIAFCASMMAIYLSDRLRAEVRFAG